MHVRDPIHGAIEITRDERAILDSPYFQRLRHIKQLGFAELAFPGATHTRHAHGIGAMAVATRIFDHVAAAAGLPEADRRRFRQALRVAVLLHDLGHPPLSHPSERALPEVGALGLPAWLAPGERRQATHEDMTLALVTGSSLAGLLAQRLGDAGAGPENVAALISGRDPDGARPFDSGGVDWAPLLRQVVSSELDADRMDYLFRDSVFTGVNYGKFDLDWLVQNLGASEQDGAAWLALDRRAVFAFEDFLLSRYHMFMSVYFHRTSVAYEKMLQRFYDDGDRAYRFPADPEGYLAADDVALWSDLRASASPWARRIVERRVYRPVYEEHPGDPERAAEVRAALEDAGLDVVVSESRGEVSKYLGARRGIFVRTGTGTGDVPVESYTPLFQRYADAAILTRLYVPPEDLDRGRDRVASVTGGG